MFGEGESCDADARQHQRDACTPLSRDGEQALRCEAAAELTNGTESSGSTTKRQDVAGPKPPLAEPKAPAVQNRPAQTKLPVVLITGFEPFNGYKLNSSWEAAKQLDGQTVNGAKVIARQLPVNYATSGAALTRAITQTRPSVVILLGQRSGPEFGIETTAVNIDDSSLRDNAGVVRDSKVPIIGNAPERYRSTLPVEAILKDLRNAGISASGSDSAGGFLCNHEFYLLQHHLATTKPKLHGGLVHVPKLPEQVSSDSKYMTMPLEKIVRGLKTVIATSVQTERNVVKITAQTQVSGTRVAADSNSVTPTARQLHPANR